MKHSHSFLIYYLICNESENVWTMNPDSFDSDYVAIAKSYTDMSAQRVGLVLLE